MVRGWEGWLAPAPDPLECNERSINQNPWTERAQSSAAANAVLFGTIVPSGSMITL